MLIENNSPINPGNTVQLVGIDTFKVENTNVYAG
jgi:hypothetical protein